MVVVSTIEHGTSLSLNNKRPGRMFRNKWLVHKNHCAAVDAIAKNGVPNTRDTYSVDRTRNITGMEYFQRPAAFVCCIASNVELAVVPFYQASSFINNRVEIINPNSHFFGKSSDSASLCHMFSVFFCPFEFSARTRTKTSHQVMDEAPSICHHMEILIYKDRFYNST